DPYGASEPVEFFAVATEAFFERGQDLLQNQPALYAELAGFYKVDPAAW
ncbi:MAG: zinc-dependent peptidase, partial [Aquabacterium sp.]